MIACGTMGDMNIFVLHDTPHLAAMNHCDKHVVKMILEYAQLLSTAHRLPDGEFHIGQGPNGKPKKFWLLRGERVVDGVIENPKCYNATHANHPCAVWARGSDANYTWLYDLFEWLACEYVFRYNKSHKTFRELGSFLSKPPRNIPAGDRTPFPLAMPEEFKNENPVQAYRDYYLGPKASFARWTKRPTPVWFKAGTKDNHVSDL